RLCFFACFLGLVLGTTQGSGRVEAILWAITGAGLIVACYGAAQFFGLDPFIDARLYTYQAASGRVLRIISTMGHADYLGNFLLYTTPLSLALAAASTGRKRRIALAGAAVSLFAIAVSGTRGAWLGLIVAAAAFAVLEVVHARLVIGRIPRRRIAIASGMLLLSGSIVISTMLASGASENLVDRILRFAGEGMTGSGRTLLWRDSLKMVTAYPVTGCGPEGFRRAFLAFKSRSLAQYAPETNNESPHNSYLDAAVSYGLVGAALYAAIIA